jgi:ethanolamine-phosphate cytidylyltransferase
MDHVVEEPGLFETLVDGKGPKPGQRIVYVDGGFDLFSSGHIAFLRKVMELEEKLGRQNGWYEPDQTAKRLKGYNEDYSPAYIVAGIHDDDVINHWKGLNYPIMNIFERGLCVLQCRVSLLLDALETLLTFFSSTSMLSFSLHPSPPANHT